MDKAYFKAISKPFQRSTNWTELRSRRDILEIEIWFGRLCDCAQEEKNVDVGISAHTSLPSCHGTKVCVWAAVWNGYRKLGSNFVSTSDMTCVWLRQGGERELWGWAEFDTTKCIRNKIESLVRPCFGGQIGISIHLRPSEGLSCVCCVDLLPWQDGARCTQD